jgi:hypothetical protein
VAVAKDASGNVLTGRVVTWSSSAPAVANVSPLGVVFALADGSATITASAEGKSASASVAVKTAVVAPPPAGGTVLAASNFENGTLGAFTYPWTQYPNDLGVMDDPTGSGRGKVVRMHYERTDPARSDDVNRALMYEKGDGIGPGQSIFFKGDLYLGPPTPGTEGATRKLLYWQRDATNNYPNFFAVLLTFGYSLRFWGAYVPVSGPMVENMTPSLAVLSPNQWYRIEMEVKLNTSFAASDGVARVWLDGRMVYEKTDMRWSDPAWAAPLSGMKFRYFLVGDQVNINMLYNETRYWDNVSFSTTRLP